MSEDPMFNMLDSTIPSPPLSESFATPYHPHDDTNTASMPFIASSLLSAPFPTARNIWASPRIQNNNVSLIDTVYVFGYSPLSYRLCLLWFKAVKGCITRASTLLVFNHLSHHHLSSLLISKHFPCCIKDHRR